jgi:hypothetical protein
VFVTRTRPLHNSFPLDTGAASPIVLGLIQGHFDIDLMTTEVREVPQEQQSEAAASYTVPVNAGMAIVIPAERIVQLLEKTSAGDAQECGGEESRTSP